MPNFFPPRGEFLSFFVARGLRIKLSSRVAPISDAARGVRHANSEARAKRSHIHEHVVPAAYRESTTGRTLA